MKQNRKAKKKTFNALLFPKGERFNILFSNIPVFFTMFDVLAVHADHFAGRAIRCQRRCRNSQRSHEGIGNGRTDHFGCFGEQVDCSTFGDCGAVQNPLRKGTYKINLFFLYIQGHRRSIEKTVT